MIIKSLKLNVKSSILLSVLLVFFSGYSLLSQKRLSVAIFQVNEMKDSLTVSQIEMRSFFLTNFKFLKAIKENKSKELILTLKDWDKLSLETKNRLSDFFQIQRFLYFTEKELDIQSWHQDVVINNYTYFISNKLYEQILIELSDD
jgi:hypothetical protein